MFGKGAALSNPPNSGISRYQLGAKPLVANKTIRLRNLFVQQHLNNIGDFTYI